MPKGIVIIDWDEFEGGVVHQKYPDDLVVQDNFIQILQISHNFNPGIMSIKEAGINAISLGNLEKQKVIVLILGKFEDGDDFHQIVYMINDIVDTVTNLELQRVFKLSQSVYKAREAVLQKLAEEIATYKSFENDIKAVIGCLIKDEKSPRTRMIYHLLIHQILSREKLLTYSGLKEKKFEKLLQKMIRDNTLLKTSEGYKIIMHEI